MGCSCGPARGSWKLRSFSDSPESTFYTMPSDAAWSRAHGARNCRGRQTPEAAGVRPRTARKWVARFKAEGPRRIGRARAGWGHLTLPKDQFLAFGHGLSNRVLYQRPSVLTRWRF